MEDEKKEMKEIISSRRENSLSLRKKKYDEIILKSRFSTNIQKYSIQESQLIIKPEYKDKRFNSLLDLLNFCSQVFKDKNSDANDIKFIIFLLKKTEIKNDIKNEVSQSNILNDILFTISKYIDDLIILDELLCILINFTYFLNPEINSPLLLDDAMKIYSNISSKYFNDDTIFNDLIILLGNLANDNPKAQKIFFDNKLFEEIYKIAINEKSPKSKIGVAIFFLANFTKGLSRNKDLVNNKNIFENLINIMCNNLLKEEYNKICLVSLGELCEIKQLGEFIVMKKEFFSFINQNKNSEFYWSINKILVNLTFVNEKINLFMVENYKNQIFPYIFNLLNSSSNILKGQGLFLLGNIIENEPCKINEIIQEAGFFDKIFENLDSISTDILDKVTFIINIIVNSSDPAGIFKLFQKNIHLKLLNILKNNYNREITNRAIDAIIDFLQKDTQDKIIKQNLSENGIKEILGRLEVDRNDAELYLKVEEIIKIFDANYIKF